MHYIKKYGNRRLYDSDLSRYITIEQLTEIIREGEDVQVIDADTASDLTAGTLMQVIIEGRHAGSLLPPTVLHQLIRLQDDALAEFFGRYVQVALELYLQAKRGVQAFSPFNPFASINPFSSWGGQSAQPLPPAPAPASEREVDVLRRELKQLKTSLRKRKK